MARYPLGANITVSTMVAGSTLLGGFRDGNGNLSNASPVSLTILRPDQSTVVYSSPTNVSTGQYTQILPLTDLTQLGHYQYVWTGTVGGYVGITSPDGFDVVPIFETLILPFQDAKDMLNIARSDTSSDDELRSKLAVIEVELENATGGPIITRTITERCELVASLTQIPLRKRPIVAVNSITSVADGSSLSIADLDIDPIGNLLRRTLGWPFLLLRGIAVNVQYQAGWGTSVDPAFAEASRIILAHLWSTQHGVAAIPAPFAQGPDLTVIPGMGFAIPNMAVDVLRPYLQEVYF
jgi:hypothetical protein